MARKRGKAKLSRKPPLAHRAAPADSDYLLDAAYEQWPHIRRMYQLFAERKPIILFDIQEERIYIYPYLEFKQDLSERSQRSLEEQYEKAIRNNQIVVFVRDNEQRRLVSFSMDWES